MINLYCLTYRTPDYLVKSLDSILETASEPLDVTLIDSKSINSQEIEEIGLNYLSQGKIKRFIQSSVNCKGFGYMWSYWKFPPTEDFAVFCDMDLLVPAGLDWIKELKGAMEDNIAAAFDLDLSNYVFPNYGHRTDWGFGFWLMGVRKSFYDSCLHKSHLTIDGQLLREAEKSGKIKLLDSAKLYHLGWDLWKDHPEYFKEKLNGINWLDLDKNLEYKVTE